MQDNVAHFGGDPERVTIFGQSAGGASVTHLMLSPIAKVIIYAQRNSKGLIGTKKAQKGMQDTLLFRFKETYGGLRMRPKEA